MLAIKEKFKSLTRKQKTLMIGCAILVCIILMIVVKAATSTGGKTNFYTVMDKVVSNQVGNFRYVIDVSTSKYVATATSETEVLSESDLTNLGSEEMGDSTTPRITPSTESRSSTEDSAVSDKLNDNWGTSSGAEVIDWDYPKYQIIITGRTESVTPLKSKLSITLATDYVNQELTDLTVIDGKYYINISKIRKWLSSAKDEKLVLLANNIPENAVYLLLNEEEFKVYSNFAEDSELSSSGTVGLTQLYQRFIVLEKTISSMLQNSIGDTGLTESNGKYYLNIESDNEVLSIFNFLKNSVNNLSSSYNGYISNLKKNKLATEEQLSQLVRERDNFLAYFSDKWLWLNSLSSQDISNTRLRVQGWGRQYTSSNATDLSYESALGINYVDVNKLTSYAVAFTGYSHPLSTSSDSVVIPTGATCTLEQVLQSNSQFSSIPSKIVKYFDVFGSPISVNTKLSYTSDLLVSDMVSEFIILVNSFNLMNPNYTKLTEDNVYDFITKYSQYSITSESSEFDKTSSELVQRLFKSINNLTGGTVVKEVVEKEADIDQFRTVISDSANNGFKVVANVNQEESNTQLIVIDAVIMNTSKKKIVIPLNKFSLQDMQSNKYPANYHTQLHEYDNGFDLKLAKEEVSLSANEFKQLKLYVLIPNGYRYFDLFFNDTKLGDIIAY